MIKLNEITKKTDQELNDFIVSERAALAQAIIDSRTKEVKGVKILAAHKKTIARALTLRRERAIAKEEAAS
ncbi:MAG TPA: 50S ribosomal protein L29 [Candidatus Saccharimonadia bacterium]|nr:50S ribosomal protein L29 [Candidatus Saccharimonadia bacterium]